MKAPLKCVSQRRLWCCVFVTIPIPTRACTMSRYTYPRELVPCHTRDVHLSCMVLCSCASFWNLHATATMAERSRALDSRSRDREQGSILVSDLLVGSTLNEEKKCPLGENVSIWPIVPASCRRMPSCCSGCVVAGPRAVGVSSRRGLGLLVVSCRVVSCLVVCFR